MKELIFKICVLVALSFSVMGCGEAWRARHSGGGDTVVGAMKAYTMVLNMRQLDSLATADTLAPNFEKWKKMYYTDYETGNRITKYTYIKRANTDNEVVYTLVPQNDTLYLITKRIIVNE